MNISKELQQAADLIKKAKNIVLMPHSKMDCDGMSASISLFLLLKKLGKNPTAVCSDPVPESFAFLPSSEVFKKSIPASSATDEKKFLVTVNTKDKGFKKLEYTVEDGKVNILMFSKNNPFEESDFSFLGAEMTPDLIITLDSGDTKQLGNMYTDNFDLFESVPVINIDHHVSNTLFGDVNLVDFKSCSTTELIYRLIPLLSEKKNLIDENIATLILAGMLTDTGSFQHSNTTPASLDIAAELIDLGAKHQQIIKHLFKTKSLATLRVWGRVLTKLQNDPIYRIVWSSVSREDLEETQSHSDETEGVIDELMATTPGTELVLFVKEREDNIISTSVRSTGPEIDSVEFTSAFGGGGHKQAAGFKIRERGGKSFEEIVSDIVFEAKKFQSKRLNIPMPKRDLISTLELDSEFSQKKEEQEKIEEKIESKDINNSVPPLPSSLLQEEEKHINKTSSREEQEEQEEEIITNRDALDTHDKVPSFEKKKNNEELSLKNPELLNKIQETKKVQEKEVQEVQEVQHDNSHSSNEEKEAIELLSPEEQSYLNAPEYNIPPPEKEIEKHEEGEYIDDLADFLSKKDEDLYIEEKDASTITHESKNINSHNTEIKKEDIKENIKEDLRKQEPVIHSKEVFDDFSSDMHEEDSILQSVSSQNISLEKSASEFLNSQGNMFQENLNQTQPLENMDFPNNQVPNNQDYIPQNINPQNGFNNQSFQQSYSQQPQNIQNTQFQQPQNFQPHENSQPSQQQFNQPQQPQQSEVQQQSSSDPFLETLNNQQK